MGKIHIALWKLRRRGGVRVMIRDGIHVNVGDYIVAWDKVLGDWYSGYVDKVDIDYQVSGFNFRMDHNNMSLKALLLALQASFPDCFQEIIFQNRDGVLSRHAFTNEALSMLVLANQDS